MARSAYCSFPNLEFARSANTTLLLLKVPNSDLNTKKSKIVIFWGPANTALLLLKVPKHGSQTGSLDIFQNRFRELGVTKTVPMSICTSYLPYRQTHDAQRFLGPLHNRPFGQLYTYYIFINFCLILCKQRARKVKNPGISYVSRPHVFVFEEISGCC